MVCGCGSKNGCQNTKYLKSIELRARSLITTLSIEVNTYREGGGGAREMTIHEEREPTFVLIIE